MRIRSEGDTVEVIPDDEEPEVQEIAEPPIKPKVDLHEGACVYFRETGR